MPTRKPAPRSRPRTTLGADWRAAALERVRAVILRAAPSIIEECKWAKPSNNMQGVPVWSHVSGDAKSRIICTGETYTDKVKLTFAHGAALADPQRLFNASLNGGTRRAIDIREGDTINARALAALVREAIALRAPAPPRRVTPSARAAAERSTPKRAAAKPPIAPAPTNPPRLLAGGNPQIAKAVGDEGPRAVRAYIAAVPGWKRAVCQRLDDTISRAVPGVRKAVKWNSPMYAAPGDDARPGYFLSVHCFTSYVKVGFFRGDELNPPPPGASKQKHVRYLDIKEHDWGVAFDDALLASWVVQASRLPGERM
jgi:hypothetical protein